MEISPSSALALCKAAHERLLATVANITDEVAGQPSRLPDWTVAQVLTHLARNADGHVRRLIGALEGREVARYSGGFEQRNREIEDGVTRSATELRLDLVESIRRLEAIWERSEQAGWPNAEILAGDHFPTSGSPLRRLREVEVHHVDLGLGYQADDWPDEYVQWELPLTLERLPQRLQHHGDAKVLLAWLIGRAGAPEHLELGPWL